MVIFAAFLLTGLVHVVAHYYKEALTVLSEVECRPSMASSRNEVRVFLLFPCQNRGKLFRCYVSLDCSAVSCTAGGFEEGSGVQFVIDVQIKPSHVGFALLKNILHYLIQSISRDNQLPVLNRVVNCIY